MNADYLKSIILQFEYYRMLGEKTFAQLPDDKLFICLNPESNSIATIVKHLWGNMMSRWTDFLTTDGEKDWRDRDSEFENDITTRAEMMEKWNEGWGRMFETLRSLKEDDLKKTIYIRNQGHTVMEAINRQLAHYPYHVGQIVFIGKALADQWQSLSIARGQSQQFNREKFEKPRHREHFTEEFLKGDEKDFNFTPEKTVQILERTPVVLVKLLENLSQDWTHHNEGGDTWSVYDVVGHLIHGERSDWMPRVRIILSQSGNKKFEPFNRFAQYEEGKGKSLTALLTEFLEAREASLRQLKELNISDSDLKRTGLHPVFGEVTLRQLLSTWAVHDLDHLSQIARVMAKQYKADVGPWVEYLKIIRDPDHKGI